MNVEEKFRLVVQNQYANSPEILHALEFAKEAHQGQFRDSGDPYITHPICVALILTEYGLDEPAIIAALLHDVVEDTHVTSKQIAETFGKEVEELVKGVTKIANIKSYVSTEAQNYESLRRMFISMAKDIRVVLIKLADRLHNMRTLEFLSTERQRKIANETQEIYVPLSERLGLCSMRGELEDWCLKYLNPEMYHNLEMEMERKYSKRKTIMEEIEQELKSILASLHIEGEVYGRFKHFSSIYKKMQKQGTEKIYDIIAHRVIVENVQDCYSVLGAIHNKWKPVAGRFKDYIASPKVNGYQSLHTTVLTPEGVPFEVQIRTHKMHKTCEYGIAAHWRYKDGGKDSKDFADKLDSIKRMVESQKRLKDSESFINALKMDFSTGEIWAFTPKRKVINLPEGSTPIDFAYAIHTSLGHRCIGAKINGKMAALSSRLETGDVVEILATPHDKAPSRDWIAIVRDSNTRSKIRSYFRHEMKQENIERGKSILELDAKNHGLPYSEIATDDALKAIFKTYCFNTEEDMFASVGAGSLTANQVIGRMIAEKVNREKRLKNNQNLTMQRPRTISKINQGVAVYGEDDVMVKLCKSCSPVPGDQILGFSVGHGITVHRADCPCIKNLAKEREVDVAWIDNNEQLAYNVNIEIRMEDKAQVLTLILNALSIKKVFINSVVAKSFSNYSIVQLSIRVSGAGQMQEIINKLSEIQGVYDIKRK